MYITPKGNHTGVRATRPELSSRRLIDPTPSKLEIAPSLYQHLSIGLRATALSTKQTLPADTQIYNLYNVRPGGCYSHG